MTINLKDNWEISGTNNFDEFVTVVSELSKITKHRKTSTAELKMLLDGYSNDKTAKVLELTKDILNDFEATGCLDFDKENTMNLKIVCRQK